MAEHGHGIRPKLLEWPHILQDEFAGLTCNMPLKLAAIIILMFHKVV